EHGADDGVRVGIQPEGSAEQVPVPAPGDDLELEETDAAAVRQADGGGVAGAEAVVGFAAGCERVARLRGVAEADHDAMVGGVQRVLWVEAEMAVVWQ